MWVMDVRLPPQPAVPVVLRQDADAALRSATHNPPPHLYTWRGARRRPDDTMHFIASDVDLIHAVTGETIWPGHLPETATLSPFAHQIAADRRAGTLKTGEDVTPGYLLRVGRVVEANGGRNPFSGLVLEKALLFLTKRQAGRVDVVC